MGLLFPSLPGAVVGILLAVLWTAKDVWLLLVVAMLGGVIGGLAVFAVLPPPSPDPKPLQDVCAAIGGTPLVRLDAAKLGFPSIKARAVYAKLEFQNPGGSVKDRVALKMVTEAERKGLITPGRTTLVEATSGNTGIGLAMVAASRGYKLIVAMPRLTSLEERYVLMRAFGAEVILSDPALKTQGFLDLAEEAAAELISLKGSGAAFLCRQFTNEDNPLAHYQSTGPEIFKALPTVGMLVAGVGTGGTLIGAGRYLKEAAAAARNGKVHVVAVEPTESRVLQGHKHRVHSLVGIGTGLQVPLVEALSPGQPFTADTSRGLIDEFASCSSGDGLDMGLKLAKTHGLLVGPSTGAAVLCALSLASADDCAANGAMDIVVIAPSSGVRYLQHPMYRAIREEAREMLGMDDKSAAIAAAAAKKKRVVDAEQERLEKTEDKKEEGAAEMADAALTGSSVRLRVSHEQILQVEEAVLTLARSMLPKPPESQPLLGLDDILIEYGASSMHAMQLLGRLRQIVEALGINASATAATTPAGDIGPAETGLVLGGLKMAMLKEALWSTARQLAHSVLKCDDAGVLLPYDNTLCGSVSVIYCGG
jgi:cysteine synthase A